MAYEIIVGSYHNNCLFYQIVNFLLTFMMFHSFSLLSDSLLLMVGNKRNQVIRNRNETRNLKNLWIRNRNETRKTKYLRINSRNETRNETKNLWPKFLVQPRTSWFDQEFLLKTRIEAGTSWMNYWLWTRFLQVTGPWMYMNIEQATLSNSLSRSFSP